MNHQLLTILLRLGLLVLLLPAAARPGFSAGALPAEADLIALLESGAAPAEKALACKRLAIVGTANAAPALGRLLADPKLGSWARIALEAIPGARVDDVLRAQLDTLSGNLLVGVINTLGVRRDARSLPALNAKLKGADPEVAAAAAVAVGRIGGTDAMRALMPLLAASTGAVRTAAAEGCILGAERFLLEGNATEARTLYDAVRDANVSPPKTLEATRGAILSRGKDGLPMLADLLASTDRSRFRLGLRVARELPEPAVATLLSTEMGRAPTDRKPPLLLALADRRDPAAQPAALAALTAGSPAEKLAAIAVLEQLQDAAGLPVLLAALTDGDPSVAQTAKSALTRWVGVELDDRLVALLGHADLNTRRAALELVGIRRVTRALPVLLKAAGDPSDELGDAALKMAGELGSLAEAPALLDLLLRGQRGPAAEGALMAMASRLARRAEAPPELVAAVCAALPKATPETKTSLLRILRACGGPQALAAVRAAAADPAPAIAESAHRVLYDWPTADALPEVSRLARTVTDPTAKVLALRGCLRLIRLMSAPPAEKFAAFQDAMSLVQRPEEKRLAMGVLREIPTPAALGVAVAGLDDAAVKTDAAAAAVALAELLMARYPVEVAAAMEKAAGCGDEKLAQRARELLAEARKGAAKRKQR